MMMQRKLRGPRQNKRRRRRRGDGIPYIWDRIFAWNEDLLRPAFQQGIICNGSHFFISILIMKKRLFFVCPSVICPVPSTVRAFQRSSEYLFYSDETRKLSVKGSPLELEPNTGCPIIIARSTVVTDWAIIMGHPVETIGRNIYEMRTWMHICRSGLFWLLFFCCLLRENKIKIALLILRCAAWIPTTWLTF